MEYGVRSVRRKEGGKGTRTGGNQATVLQVGNGPETQKYEIIKRTFGVVVSGKSPWSPHLRYGVRCPDLFGVGVFYFFFFIFFFAALWVSYPLLPRHAIRPSDYAELDSRK